MNAQERSQRQCCRLEKGPTQIASSTQALAHVLVVAQNDDIVVWDHEFAFYETKTLCCGIRYVAVTLSELVIQKEYKRRSEDCDGVVATFDWS